MSRTYWEKKPDGTLEFLGAFTDGHKVKDQKQPQGRGAVIDEAALIEALRNRSIRGAALDVFEQEPLPSGHPFYGMDNLLLSPHCADHTETWIDDAMQFFTENLGRFERGEPLKNVVEKKLGY